MDPAYGCHRLNLSLYCRSAESGASRHGVSSVHSARLRAPRTLVSVVGLFSIIKSIHNSPTAVERMAVWPFTGHTMPTRPEGRQTKGRARFAHAYPCTRPTQPAACVHTLRFARFQHTATDVHIFASWAHKACHPFSQHCQHYACAARCRPHYLHASRKPCTFPRSNCRPESHLATFLLLATLTRLSPFLHSLLRAQDILEHSGDAIRFVSLRCSSSIREDFCAMGPTTRTPSDTRPLQGSQESPRPLCRAGVRRLAGERLLGKVR